MLTKLEIMKKYDLVIIGAGSGGYVAAIRAAQLGLTVALIEKDEIGGTCLNRGCIPVKTLLESTNFLERAKKADRFGISIQKPEPSLPKIIDRKNKIVEKLRNGVLYLLNNYKIDIISGTAKLSGRQSIQVKTKEGAKEIRAPKIIIATGSEPLELPNVAFDNENILSSTPILNIEKIPKSLLIIGGGYIGCEFATIFNSLGTEVTIVEMMPQLLPDQDAKIARILQTSFKKKGIIIHLDTTVDDIEKQKNKLKYKLNTGEQISAEKALVSIGRKFNSENLGLELLGIKTESGAILVDEYMETNVSGIYAIGDVVNKGLLAYVAHHQGITAAENAAGKPIKMDYRVIPNCIYTNPEIATVGLNQKQAEAEGHSVNVGKFPFAAQSKAVITDDTEGFVQVVSDSTTDQILGVQIIGPDATNLISEAAALIKMEATVEELIKTIHPHPTLTEAIMEAGMDAKGHPIHIISRKKQIR